MWDVCEFAPVRLSTRSERRICGERKNTLNRDGFECRWKFNHIFETNRSLHWGSGLMRAADVFTNINLNLMISRTLGDHAKKLAERLKLGENWKLFKSLSYHRQSVIKSDRISFQFTDHGARRIFHNSRYGEAERWGGVEGKGMWMRYRPITALRHGLKINKNTRKSNKNNETRDNTQRSDD